MNIQAKSDVSYLFSNLGSTGSSGSLGNLNFLSDYASIKNGSYAKLMKSYYSETSSDQVSSIVNSTSTDTAKTLATMESATDSLKEAADALLETGKESVFQTNEDGEIDTDKVYSALESFTKSYNQVLDASDDVKSTTVLGKVSNMVSATAANEKMLASVGITIGENNELSIDKDTFAKADMNSVKTLFQGASSYGYRVSAQSSLIDFAAQNEAAKSNTYGQNGTYSNTYNTGNIFNSYF